MINEDDVILVTVPCRTCGEPVKVRVRKQTTDEEVFARPNLTASCPQHGQTQLQLRHRPEQNPPWTYLNAHGVELGRGETPQGAIDAFHKDESPNTNAPEKSALRSSLSTGEQQDTPSLSSPEENGPGTPSASPTIHPHPQPQGAIEMSMQSLQDIPRWFRTQDSSLRWFAEMARRELDIEGWFDHRFLLLLRHPSEQKEEPARWDFLGVERPEELKDLAKEALFGEEEFLWIRDQDNDVFLKPVVDVRFEELPEEDPTQSNQAPDDWYDATPEQ